MLIWQSYYRNVKFCICYCECSRTFPCGKFQRTSSSPRVTQLLYWHSYFKIFSITTRRSSSCYFCSKFKWFWISYAIILIFFVLFWWKFWYFLHNYGYIYQIIHWHQNIQILIIINFCIIFFTYVVSDGYTICECCLFILLLLLDVALIPIFPFTRMYPSL